MLALQNASRHYLYSIGGQDSVPAEIRLQPCSIVSRYCSHVNDDLRSLQLRPLFILQQKLANGEIYLLTLLRIR